MGNRTTYSKRNRMALLLIKALEDTVADYYLADPLRRPEIELVLKSTHEFLNEVEAKNYRGKK